MPTTVLSSRQFNQDSSSAKKAAQDGPVVITDRGRPAHVLLTFEEYTRLSATRTSIADLLYMPHAAEIELDIPPRTERVREIDLD